MAAGVAVAQSGLYGSIKMLVEVVLVKRRKCPASGGLRVDIVGCIAHEDLLAVGAAR